MRNFRRFQIAFVCLGFTGGAVAWADPPQPPQPDFYVEDPYAPHNTSGNTARVGTVVGFVYGEPVDVLAIGLSAAAGHRFGRLALESEFTYMQFEGTGIVMTPIGLAQGDVAIGNGERLGVIARYDVIRLGPHVVGPNSLLSIYVEGGAANAWNHWYRPSGNEASSQLVPNDTERVEAQAGFGLMLDHRLQEPVGFPHRVGWFLGWRMAFAPHEPMSGVECRGTSACRAVTMPDDGSTAVDHSMLFQSSLQFTF